MEKVSHARKVCCVRMMPKVFLILVLVLNVASASGAVRTGADRLFEEPYFEWIRGKRLGLITNATGVNSKLQPIPDLLAARDDVRLVSLFAPEHGISGQASGAGNIQQYRGIPVYSIYGETRAPTTEMLKDVDVLVYDIQDVGVRFYTYISTMFLSMKAAAEHGLPFVVLDRPNPITGTRIGGPILEEGLESFVGIYRLPIRYGMTAGELARLLNEDAEVGCDLRIVPASGWARHEWYEPQVPPSPNMPTLTTAIVYPGFCLLEGTNLSEGRGTTRPFEIIGAPWLDAGRLADRLNDLGLPGVRFRPQAFTPRFSKYQGEVCQGVQAHVLDRESFEPIPAILHLLAEVRRLHPEQLEFRDGRFDRLAGTRWIRENLLEGRPVEEIVNRWKDDLREFERKREKHLLY